MVKIFLNAGHGGPDPGAVNNNYKLTEKELNLKICLEIAAALKLVGVDSVIYQEQKSLNEVPGAANATGADYFVSIHMNAADNKTASGIETLYHPTSTKGKEFAQRIQKSLVAPFKSYTFSNRGIVADSRGLLVLRSTNMPAVLIEFGFISNDKEAQWVNNNIIDVGTRIASSIVDFLREKGYLQETLKKQLSTYKLIPSNGKWNLEIDNVIILKENKLETVITYIEGREKS
jgi:N-acetylmuramoyl-L-alanine amidase